MNFHFYITYLALIIAVGILSIIDPISVTTDAFSSILLSEKPDD